MGLGMFDEIPNIRHAEIDIYPGDKLLCYTDGLVEAENNIQQDFGTVPIEACISLNISMEKILEKLILKLKDFIRDIPVSDDISILGIEFR